MSDWKGMDIVRRAEWGARPYKGEPTTHRLTRESILFVHYSAGQGRSIDTKAEQVATIKAIQAMHQDQNGWSDIAYHFVVFQPYGDLKYAKAYQGRELSWVPAAQSGFNTRNIAVCVVCGPGEPIKVSTVNRIKSIYTRVPAERVKGHRDVNPTSCPGDLLYSKLPQIRKAK